MLTNKLIFKGPGVCLYGIHEKVNRPSTTSDVIFYFVYNIVYIVIYDKGGSVYIVCVESRVIHMSLNLLMF